MNTVRIEEIINDYKRWRDVNPDSWIIHCKSQDSLEEAIECAARAKNHEGKKNPHQYRLRIKAIDAFVASLNEQKAAIAQVQTFKELLQIITKNTVKYIGPLAHYDTAVRIGAWLDLSPEYIYIHCGTKVGAERLLKRKIRTPFINISELPSPFLQARLTNDELENLLCICKDCFLDENKPCPPVKTTTRC
ncbi:hypothetical protein [Ascidiimonas sp. W6]|uniref:hypothetical protein n=1 Tax=Ascidiimonas meishanensis TaxID=3128903 RepID=UPI0030EF7B0A